MFAEYGDPVGGPSVYRTTDGTTWSTVYGPDATQRHIHDIAPDPFNDGHWWMTCGDGTAKTIQRSTDGGDTWSVVVASSVWQGVQISFTEDLVWIAGDSQRGTVMVLDRTDLTPRMASKNAHNLLPVPSSTASKTWDAPSVADGAMTSTTVTLTGVSAGGGPFIAASVSTALPAGVQLTAAVTAANTVTVTLVNHSGGAVDLASATLRVSTVGGAFYGNAYFGIVDPDTGVYYCVANDTSVAGTTPGWFMLPQAGDSLDVFGTFPDMQASAMYLGGGYVFAGNYRHAVLTPAA